MATVTGYTAQRMKQIEDETVVDGEVVGDNLHLITRAGTQIDAGSVRGPVGPVGPAGPTIPSGIVTMYAGATAPEGYLLCNGAEIKRADYPALFTAIGTTWGAGDGSTTFRIPDLQNRFPVGKGPATWSDALNEKGGNKDAVLPSHKHIAPSHVHPITHQHPGGSTDNAAPWHYHTMDHDHPNVVTDSQGYHNHYSSGDAAVNVIGAVAGGIQMDTGSGGPNAPTFGYYTYTSAGGQHQHNVDVPPYSGTTGWADTTHAHNVTIPQFAGNSGPSGNADTTIEGVSATDANLPPFVTINYIIKI